MEILGKIVRADFGFGGYQGAMVGAFFEISIEDESSVIDFWGYWSHEPSDGARWTEDDRLKFFGELVIRISKLLEDAKVNNISELQGIPVKVTFTDGSLSSWRILTEVL